MKAWKALTKHCTTLKTLDLTIPTYEQNFEITDLSFSEMNSNWSNLESLSFNNINQITDLSLMKFSEFCPRLTTINFSCLYLITAAGFRAIFSNCKNLETIKLEHFHNDSVGASLIEISKSCFNLKVLKICELIGELDQSLIEISKYCKKLEVVEITYCSKISEVAIQHLIENLSLKSLILNGKKIIF
jgi:hypothetical protein